MGVENVTSGIYFNWEKISSTKENRRREEEKTKRSRNVESEKRNETRQTLILCPPLLGRMNEILKDKERERRWPP